MRESLISPILPNLPDNRYIFPFLKKMQNFGHNMCFIRCDTTRCDTGRPVSRAVSWQKWGSFSSGIVGRGGKFFKWRRRIYTPEYHSTLKRHRSLMLDVSISPRGGCKTHTNLETCVHYCSHRGLLKVSKSFRYGN